MSFKRTNETQTERTATGIITTCREYDPKTKQSRWVQIGYTSLETRIVDDVATLVATGPYGQKLLNETSGEVII